MKFFLMILVFTPGVLAEEVLAPGVRYVMDMEDAEEVMAQRSQAVRGVMEDAEEVMAQRSQAVRGVMEDAEEVMAQRVRAVDASDFRGIDGKPGTQRIRLVPQVPQRENLRPEVKRIDLIPGIQWEQPFFQKRKELMEMYHDMSVKGKHLRALIVGSDGDLCGLSQDPLQCCVLPGSVCCWSY